jgi:hypothetical protein
MFDRAFYSRNRILRETRRVTAMRYEFGVVSKNGEQWK